MTHLKMASIVACIGMAAVVGCAAPAEAPSGSASDNEGQRPAPTAANDAESVSQQAGKKLTDPAYDGMVKLGGEGAWTFYFDKSKEMIVASDGSRSVLIDPSRAHETTRAKPVTVDGMDEGNEVLSWQGWACRAACWGAAGAGCAAVAGACTWGTVITIGGFALPCSYATIAACGAAGGGASVCSDWCTATFG